MKKLKMKRITCLLLGLLLNSNIHLAMSQEYGQVLLQHDKQSWAVETIDIKENYILEILSCARSGSNAYMTISSQESSIKIRPADLDDADSRKKEDLSGFKVIGPSSIKFQSLGSNSIFCLYKITEINELDQKSSKHALVLPEGEGGKQKLVLESSTDLVSWIEDSLGSKDSSDKKRFYRLRAVKE